MVFDSTPSFPWVQFLLFQLSTIEVPKSNWKVTLLHSYTVHKLESYPFVFKHVHARKVIGYIVICSWCIQTSLNRSLTIFLRLCVNQYSL